MTALLYVALGVAITVCCSSLHPTSFMDRVSFNSTIGVIPSVQTGVAASDQAARPPNSREATISSGIAMRT